MGRTWSESLIDTIKGDIKLQIGIYNKKMFVLKLKDRDIKSFKERDIAFMEIKKSDEILKYIKFFNYDLNYMLGSDIYKNAHVFLKEYLPNNNLVYETGKIIEINNFEFEHTIPTGSSASRRPILLLNKNNNKIVVIGIHERFIADKNINIGTFIWEISKEEKDNNMKPNEIIKKNNDDKCLVLFKSIEQLINYMKFD